MRIPAAERGRAAVVATLSPLPAVPADTTNAYANNAAAARLGQMLFFDKSYSGAIATGAGDTGTNGGLGKRQAIPARCRAHRVTRSAAKVSTTGARCRATSRSATNFGTRNALSIVNSSFYKWTNWGGKFDSQWSLPLAVAEDPAHHEQHATDDRAHALCEIPHRVRRDFPVPLDPDLDPASANAARFPASGKPGQASWDTAHDATDDKAIINRIYANYGKAIDAYMRTLVSRNSPFDRFAAGDKTAISPAAIRGLKLFIKNDCVGCHSGPNFTDDQFHALMVPQTGPHVPASDTGRFGDISAVLANPFNVNSVYSDDTATGKLTGLTADAGMTGQFRTKSLRNVAHTGPFMHSGQPGNPRGRDRLLRSGRRDRVERHHQGYEVDAAQPGGGRQG